MSIELQEQLLLAKSRLHDRQPAESLGGAAWRHAGSNSLFLVGWRVGNARLVVSTVSRILEEGWGAQRGIGRLLWRPSMGLVAAEAVSLTTSC